MRQMIVGVGFACSLLAPGRLAAQENGSLAGIVWLGVGVGAVIRLLESGAVLKLGDEIRVRQAHADDARGTLVDVRPDAIVLREGDSTRTIPRGEVRGIHRYDGIEHKWAQGWGIGFLAGGALGIISGEGMGDDRRPSDQQLSANEKAAILGIVGAFSGASIGALIGVFSTGEHWRSAHPLPASLGVAPSRGGGVSIGVRIAF